MIVTVLSLMTAIVGCARNAEVPEIVGRTILSGHSNDRAIFFNGIDGATGYELKLYMSESHTIPYNVIQWESHWQTAIPDVYYIPVETFPSRDQIERSYFTLQPTSNTTNSGEGRDTQRMLLGELPSLTLLDAEGRRVDLRDAARAVSINKTLYSDEDGNQIERVVDIEGNIISERIWNEHYREWRKIEVIE